MKLFKQNLIEFSGRELKFGDPFLLSFFNYSPAAGLAIRTKFEIKNCLQTFNPAIFFEIF